MGVFNTTSRAAIVAALLGLATPALSQTKFTIISRLDQEATAQIDLERWLDFEASVSLKVRTDPALVPSARVIELVESIPMVDDAGIRITRGYDIDVAHDLVVAMSGGTAEIVRVRDQPSGLEVAALFKDDQGKIVTPPQGSLAAYTTGGQRLCFDQSLVEQEITNPVPMAFTLLLDRSGSMSEEIEQVRQAALGFIDALPDTGQCTVVAFGTSYSVDPREGLGTDSCRAENFLQQPLGLDGATDLFTPLGWTYSTLAAPHMADHQKAVIILTDGGVNERTKDVALMEALKRDALTFVYFLGGHEDRYLKSLADHYITHRGDLSGQLGRYFDVVSTAYAKQTVLRLVPCGGTAPKRPAPRSQALAPHIPGDHHVR